LIIIVSFYIAGMFGSGIAQVILTNPREFFILHYSYTRNITQNFCYSLVVVLNLIYMFPYMNTLTIKKSKDLLADSGADGDSSEPSSQYYKEGDDL